MSATLGLAPGLIVAAPASGGGKTTVTLALLRHFRNAGVRVASFKVGPDYIDPAFHRAAGGRSCPNVDAWAMAPETIAALLAGVSADADLVIGEGVMGLFDGAGDGTGSTADVAVLMRLPVLLVVDVRAQAGSAAAVVHGFRTFRSDVDVAGVVFNRVGGEGHARALTAACESVGVPVLGMLPRLDALALADRHLGLVQAVEHAGLDAFIERAAAAVAAHVDTAAVRALARPPRLPAAGGMPGVPPLGQRIAVASDAAFAFAYPHLLDGWRAAGAAIAPFSPLADEAPGAGADAVFLPGGYPELHAGRLAANARFLGGLRRAADAGAALYGECGGYMALGRGLADAEGRRHAMAGLLPLETSFAERRLHLGYRRARLAADTPLGPAGARFRGHEFHYAAIVEEGGGDPLFACADALGADLGPAGRRIGSVMGSFVHLIDADRR